MKVIGENSPRIAMNGVLAALFEICAPRRFFNIGVLTTRLYANLPKAQNLARYFLFFQFVLLLYAKIEKRFQKNRNFLVFNQNFEKIFESMKKRAKFLKQDGERDGSSKTRLRGRASSFFTFKRVPVGANAEALLEGTVTTLEKRR